MRALDKEVKEAGIVVMNEIGLDPGIDHLYAIKMIDEVHAKGGKVRLAFSSNLQPLCSYDTHCGADQTIPVLLRRPSSPRMRK
jgi:hypothetical protein